jgi:hypothetical protein
MDIRDIEQTGIVQPISNHPKLQYENQPVYRVVTTDGFDRYTIKSKTVTLPLQLTLLGHDGTVIKEVYIEYRLRDDIYFDDNGNIVEQSENTLTERQFWLNMMLFTPTKDIDLISMGIYSLDNAQNFFDQF